MAYSVYQINTYIKKLLGKDPALDNVSVKGELSNVKYHSSGHIYFTLKDSRSQLSGIMFGSNAGLLKFKLENGQEVTVTGSITVYEANGKYQIYAEKIKRDGVGELYEKFEELKNELEEMGMFDEMYKKPIPKYVKRLGVITAPTGAAVKDIINVSKRRNPYIEIILYPALVQGNGAKESIVKGIKTIVDYKPDVIIVGRGGGSIEDLWAFNEREVAEAIFNCPIPIISGTGHETDHTIADFVADLRASTPSAAAEQTVCEYDSFENEILSFWDALNSVIDAKLERAENRAEKLRLRLEKNSPEAVLKEKRIGIEARKGALYSAFERRLNAVEQRFLRQKTALITEMDKLVAKARNKLEGQDNTIRIAMNSRVTKAKQKQSIYAEKLNGLSPLNSLSRGYSFVSDKDGLPVKDVNGINIGDSLNIYVKNGRIEADVTDKREGY
ncbi:MAG: exodeoxyribonuclease VII large subunit [Lachnospiraceae bacterium]|nr:exodeoxyribonuclease VII large subunit [Lachnospiraceae bacterium]